MTYPIVSPLSLLPFVTIIVCAAHWPANNHPQTASNRDKICLAELLDSAWKQLLSWAARNVVRVVRSSADSSSSSSSFDNKFKKLPK